MLLQLLVVLSVVPDELLLLLELLPVVVVLFSPQPTNNAVLPKPSHIIRRRLI
jgi:hypothetical protein